MLNFSSILIFSEDPQSLSDFYEKVLDEKPDWVDNGYHGFQAGNTYLTIGPHDQVKGKNLDGKRIMINFETDNVKKEFERIKELGATVVAEPYSMGNDESFLIATFEDPDGNIFQLMTPFDVDLTKN